MKVTLALYSKRDLQEFQSLKKHQKDLVIILGFKEVSRFFEYTLEECLACAKELKEAGFTVFLQWDVLMTEEVFGGLFHSLRKTNVFSRDCFDGFRIQDPGLLYALKEVAYEGDIHFICEQGNHNLIGLKSWIKVWPQAIKRLVVSPQLPAVTLKKYSEEIYRDFGVELEVLGFGPILLFYTPRKLVSPLYGEESEQETYKVAGTSEESPHKGFPIIENQQGTFMLNTKDQFLFEELFKTSSELLNLSQLHWRVDPICGLGAIELGELVTLLLSSNISLFDKIKDDYQRPTTKGFFRVNKTDVLFKKLKNHRLQGRDESFVGEVVDVKKKGHVAVLIKSEDGMSKGDSLRLLSPEGREKFVKVDKMTDALATNLEKAHKGQIVFIPPVGGISVRSMVFSTIN